MTEKPEVITKFRVEALADFGKDLAETKVFNTLLGAQSSLTMTAIESFAESNGRPFKNTAHFELSGKIDRDRIKEWVLESLRKGYGGPSFVVTVEFDDEADLPVEVEVVEK